MSRNVLLTQKIRDERHEQILNAALHIFASKGLSATKISDIAAEAKVSHGLVHHYFGSKEDIFTAVVERAMQGSIRVSEEALQRPGTPWQRLTALCEMMLDGVRKDPEYVLLIIQARVNEEVPDKARAVLVEYGEVTNSNLIALIQAGQNAGEIIEGDPHILANTLSALIQGLALSNLHGKGLATFPDTSLILRLFEMGDHAVSR